MRLRMGAGGALRLLAAASVLVSSVAGPSGSAHAASIFDFMLGGGALQPSAGTLPEVGTLTVHRRGGRQRAAPRGPRAQAKMQPSTAPSPKAEVAHKPDIAIDPVKVADWYLSDRTLRRGDIVVLRSGVLVYKGRNGREARRPADFARLRDARFLSARTRDFVARATAANAYSAVAVAPAKPKMRAVGPAKEQPAG